MAHKKGAGSTKNGRDSNPKRLGVKRFAGQWVFPGQVLVRQRGAVFKPSLPQTQRGRDFTIYSNRPGFLSFKGRRLEVSCTPRPSLLVCKFAHLWAME